MVKMLCHLSDEESCDGGDGHDEIEEEERSHRAQKPRHRVEHRAEEQRVHTGKRKLQHT